MVVLILVALLTSLVALLASNRVLLALERHAAIDKRVRRQVRGYLLVVSEVRVR